MKCLGCKLVIQTILPRQIKRHYSLEFTEELTSCVMVFVATNHIFYCVRSIVYSKSYLFVNARQARKITLLSVTSTITKAP